jgi:hypothetical protein
MLESGSFATEWHATCCCGQIALVVDGGCPGTMHLAPHALLLLHVEHHHLQHDIMRMTAGPQHLRAAESRLAIAALRYVLLCLQRARQTDIEQELSHPLALQACQHTAVHAHRIHLHIREFARPRTLNDGRGKRHSSAVSACFKCIANMRSYSSFKKST